VEFRDQNTGFGIFYEYNYNQAGRITAQHMDYDGGAQTFDAAYTWDNEGRMTGINYGPSYSLQYDVNGRLSGMQDTANGNATVASANYGVAGERLGLTYFGYSESRDYNNLLQMTRMTVSGMMDMQYVYQAGQNNGRIVQSIDGIANETVNYSYDLLNRLSAASATNGSWGQAFTYDGFGNLTAKTVTQGSAPSLSVSYDPATNHQIGPTYDSNGNLNLSYWGDTFDVENRLIASGNDDRYAYDPSGKRVKKSYYPMMSEYYFYSITGQKLITVNCDNGACGGPQYNVYFGGKLVKSKGVVVVTDRLGSVRANSNGEQFRYFAQNDPVNYMDPGGLDRVIVTNSQYFACGLSQTHCGQLFAGKMDLDKLQKAGLGLTLYDATNSAVGSRQASTVVPGQTGTLAQAVGDDYATILADQDGNLTKNVVLGEQFFGLDYREAQGTLLHEALHRFLNLGGGEGDPDLKKYLTDNFGFKPKDPYSTHDITEWLKGDCR
jgi:YD repeat-containing protein